MEGKHAQTYFFTTPNLMTNAAMRICTKHPGLKKYQCIPGTSFKVHYSELIENHAIIGPVIKSIEAQDDEQCKDACFMNVPDVCYMFNYYTRDKKCELLYKDRLSEYKVMKRSNCSFMTRKCMTNPCQNGGRCYSLGEDSHSACSCKQEGKACQATNKEVTTKSAAATETRTAISEIITSTTKGITTDSETTVATVVATQPTTESAATTRAATVPPTTDAPTTAQLTTTDASTTTAPTTNAPQTVPAPTAPPTTPPGNVWIKVNTNPVCIGAKGDDFGKFYTTKKGEIKRFKLVYISGGLRAEALNIGGAGRWGAGLGVILLVTKLELHVTDKTNNRISPPVGYALDMSWGRMGYDIPGYNINSDTLVFPLLSTARQANVGDEYRIWYGADLQNAWELDNGGQTCADVHVYYTIISE